MRKVRQVQHVRELKRLLPAGYKLQQAGGAGKISILNPQGEMVRLPNGVPLRIHSSPTDNRAHKNMVALLRQAGVI